MGSTPLCWNASRSRRTSRLLLLVLALHNEQNVVVACHSVGRIEKASNHSEDKLPNCLQRSNSCMRTFCCQMHPRTLDHHFSDKGLETPTSIHSRWMSSRSQTHHRHRTCPTP